jgi:hypothetical protein
MFRVTVDRAVISGRAVRAFVTDSGLVSIMEFMTDTLSKCRKIVEDQRVGDEFASVVLYGKGRLTVSRVPQENIGRPKCCQNCRLSCVIRTN